MKTDDLILQLAKDAVPVRRLKVPFVRFCRWLGASFLCLAAGVAVFGWREDLVAVGYKPGFILQGILILGLVILSAFSAFVLSVPDRKKTCVDVIPLLTLFLWFVVISYSCFTSETFPTGMGFSCAKDILVLGLIPGALLFLMIRRAAPLQLGKVGAFCALSVAGLGALGTQFICSNDNPLHVLMWHYTPVLILGAVGMLLGRWFLTWNHD